MFSNLRITFLGTGTSQGIPVIGSTDPVCLSENPKDKRLRTSALVEFDDKKVVIDTGPDFRQQMLLNNVDWLDAVLYTHEHRDHIGGFDDLRPLIFKSRKPMEVYASKRVCDSLVRDFFYAFEEKKYPGAPEVKLNPFGQDSFKLFDKTIEIVNVEHYTFPVQGFRFGDLTYITDANLIPDSEKEKIKGSKLLVLNALRIEKHYSHFNLQEAIDLANELEAEYAYFTHISHKLGFHEEVSKTLPKNMFLAYDGLTLDVDKL